MRIRRRFANIARKTKVLPFVFSEFSPLPVLGSAAVHTASGLRQCVWLVSSNDIRARVPELRRGFPNNTGDGGGEAMQHAQLCALVRQATRCEVGNSSKRGHPTRLLFVSAGKVGGEDRGRPGNVRRLLNPRTRGRGMRGTTNSLKKHTLLTNQRRIEIHDWFDWPVGDSPDQLSLRRKQLARQIAIISLTPVAL